MNEETPQTPRTPAKQGDKNLIAILSYLGILFLIPLLAAKDNPFAQYHAKQGLVLFIAEIIGWFLTMIPFIGWFVIGPILWIIWLVLGIIGIVNVVKGKQAPLPIIGRFAGKFKI